VLASLRTRSIMADAAAVAASGLLGLADDALGEVGHILADPLDPRVAVALGSTAKGLSGPMAPALTLLRTRHAAAGAFAKKVGMSCAELREATGLAWTGQAPSLDINKKCLNAAIDMETLAMLIKTNGLRKLEELYLPMNRFGDKGAIALLAGMGPGSLPRATNLYLSDNDFGPKGAVALADALAAGAMPNLTQLGLGGNKVGDEGIAKLAGPLRQRPIQMLHFAHTGITDKGVASLFSNLGEEEFQQLKLLELSDAFCAMLVSIIDSGHLPAITRVSFSYSPTSRAAQHAVGLALMRAKQRRASQLLVTPASSSPPLQA